MGIRSHTQAADTFDAFRDFVRDIPSTIDDADYVDLMRAIADHATEHADSVASHAPCRRYPPGTRIRLRADGRLATVDSCDRHHVHATVDTHTGSGQVYLEWDTVEDLEKEAEIAL